MNNDSSVAVIMRSKNEQPYPRPSLEALFKQTWTEFTLYNVDSGSTDGTLEVIREFNSEHLTEIAPEDYIPGKVLNDMIAKTSEDIIVFLNADATPVNDDWLDKLLAPILRDETDATMSWQGPRDNAYFVVKYDYKRAYDPRNIKGDNSDFFSAVGCAFKREMWEQHKFRVVGYAEDLAWAKACGTSGSRFKLVLDSKVIHSHNYTIKGLYRKKFRHGVTFAEIYGTRPHLAKRIFSCGKELVRDFLYAICKLRLDTIPYNIVYRITIHLALYKGICEGTRLNG